MTRPGLRCAQGALGLAREFPAQAVFLWITLGHRSHARKNAGVWGRAPARVEIDPRILVRRPINKGSVCPNGDAGSVAHVGRENDDWQVGKPHWSKNRGKKSGRLGRNFCNSSTFCEARHAKSREETSLYTTFFSSFAHLETRTRFPLDDLAIRME